MLTVAYKIRDIKYPECYETFLTEDERIQIVGYEIYLTDITISTSLKEIQNIKEYFISKGYSNALHEYIYLEDFVKENPGKPGFSFADCAKPYKNEALKYLILRELLFGQKLIRVIKV